MSNTALQPGVVVIGRNEGERLRRCLASIVAPTGSPPRTIVYVDSGSIDTSIDLARSRGVEVVDLDMSRPFSAARGRNAGLARLLELAPDTTYVQFVDGDCEVHPSWLATATAALASEPQLAAVCGRLRERHPTRSLYNKLCDLEWDAPTGLVRSCGGNAMYRLAPLLAVGRFNDAVIAGEEPELCYRLRQAGHTIRRLSDDMALHDADMHTFRQWWRRAARGGYAMAHGAALHGHAPERFNIRRIRSVLFWAAAIPLATMLWPILCFALIRPFTPNLVWVFAAFAGAVIPAQYLTLLARVAALHARQGRDTFTAFTVALFTILAKFAELTGLLRFWLTRPTKSSAAAPNFDKRPAAV